MTRNNEDGKSPSKSFIIGAVALAFLLIGYQTAVFIHRAATLKILSSVPDTVYVAVPASGPGDVAAHDAVVDEPVQHAASRQKRQYASSAAHRRVEVRERFSERRCENFRFDPNTAGIDELRRLGFSLKQAEAIDNYRSKGGRFRRKSSLPTG